MKCRLHTSRNSNSGASTFVSGAPLLVFWERSAGIECFFHSRSKIVTFNLWFIINKAAADAVMNEEPVFGDRRESKQEGT